MEERLSINSRSLKKYGSTTSRKNTKNETYVNHQVSRSDTLQGIALKYGVTVSKIKKTLYKIFYCISILQMEQIRRANRLWASDSLFLRETLLIPVELENSSDVVCKTSTTTVTTPLSSSSSSSQIHSNYYDNENVNDFLVKIDASIANTKEEVKKVQGNSE